MGHGLSHGRQCNSHLLLVSPHDVGSARRFVAMESATPSAMSSL